MPFQVYFCCHHCWFWWEWSRESNNQSIFRFIRKILSIHSLVALLGWDYSIKGLIAVMHVPYVCFPMHNIWFGGIQHLELGTSRNLYCSIICRRIANVHSARRHHNVSAGPVPSDRRTLSNLQTSLFSTIVQVVWLNKSSDEWLGQWKRCETTVHCGILGQVTCTVAPCDRRHSPLLSPRDCCRPHAICFVVFPLPRLLCIRFIPANTTGGQRLPKIFLGQSVILAFRFGSTLWQR